MSGINRRHFIQFAGSTLVTLGLTPLQVNRYSQVLAENTPRKRALLVGINRYNDGKWISLEGAENDVALQKALLIHRFGFAEADIKTLRGKEATRQEILATFKSHLSDWAQPGDVVVFHFSGHGSSVADPENALGTGRVSTIVPVDSQLPNGYPNTGGEVNDITGHTLWLLMRSLKTENVTFVLDSCHAGGARKGVLTVRSRPGDGEILKSGVRLVASQAERDFQKKLMGELGIKDAAELGLLRKAGVPQGMMLSAAQENQSAIDAPFGDTSAGIFTYVLTRYLWQQTGQEPMGQVMDGTIAATQRILRDVFPSAGAIQQPILNVRQGGDRDRQPVYFTNSRNVPAAAVITKVAGDQVDLFLGGIDPKTLEAFGKGAVFTLPNGQGQVQVASRDQFQARGVLVKNRGSVQSGVFLQERSRAIPHDLVLRIGLDASLGQDIGQAKQLLEGIKRIAVVSADDRTVHYVLGRVTEARRQALQKTGVPKLPEVGSIALFSSALDLVPDAAGMPKETIGEAIGRLRSKLKALLAARLLKLMLNVEASGLKVSAAIQTSKGASFAGQVFTVRGGALPVANRSSSEMKSRLAIGQDFRVVVQNQELRDLYMLVVLVGPEGSVTVAPASRGEEASGLVKGQQSLETIEFTVAEPVGMAEVLVIASTTSLSGVRQTLQALASEVRSATESIDGLLAGLETGTRSGDIQPNAGISPIHTEHIAALSMTFEVKAGS
jgi:Caspase domain